MIILTSKKKRGLKLFVSILFCIFLLPLFNFSQESIADQLAWYKSTGEKALSKIKIKLYANLPSGEKSIVDSIRYEVVPVGNLLARSKIEDGKRLVQLTSGLIQTIEWITDMSLIAEAKKAKQCFQDYLGYLSNGILTNTEIVEKKLKRNLVPVATPFTYVSQINANCPKISEEDFRRSPELTQLRGILVIGSLMFLSAHETAHHVLHHAEREREFLELLKTDKLKALEMSRKNENAADLWAFKRMADVDSFPFIEAYPILVLISILNDYYLEEMYSHPAGPKRLKMILDETVPILNNDSDFQDWLLKNNLKNQFDQSIKQFDDLYKKLLGS